jgi:hypothetical protein
MSADFVFSKRDGIVEVAVIVEDSGGVEAFAVSSATCGFLHLP